MKILIIEDEPELAKSIASYLSGQNYMCEPAINEQQAWRSHSMQAVEVTSRHYMVTVIDEKYDQPTG